MLDVLLVDDDELVRQTLSLLLTREGFAVVAAGGGREAVEAARRQLFDLVICDVRMGDMDGLETVAALREHLPEAHVVLITGYADPQAPIQALRLKVDDYLSKPFDLDDFLARIRALRRQRRPGPPGRVVLLQFTEELRRRTEWAEHVQEVERAAVGAAERLGLPAEEVQALRLAARLHDLVSGAPAVPDEEPLDPVARLLVSLGAPSDWPAQQILNAAVEAAHGHQRASAPPPVREEVPSVEGGERLRLVTLGETRIEVDRRVVPPAAWESARARWLLLYLVSRRGQSIPQERLRDLFWPDSDGDRAQRALVSTVHRLRKALDLPEVVERQERSYRFNTAVSWWWDVDRMERSFREGQAAEKSGRMAEAARAYRAAGALYRGEFLPQCAEDWVLPVRESARRTALESLERAAGLLLPGDPEAAESAARRALEIDSTSETAGAALVRALSAQGRADEAVKGYHRLVAALQRQLDLPPGPELVRAYLEITSPGGC